MNPPTIEEIEAATDVLLWLHETTEDGRHRDSISFVRHLLHEAAEGNQQ